MSATHQRDHAINLAKTNPSKALILAREISDPWFRAQALAWVIRFTSGSPVAIASEAAKAAQECEDDYKKSAVRTWEIAALAERNCMKEAKHSLKEALSLAKRVEPNSSRSEALILLLQSAFKIGNEEAKEVFEILKKVCAIDEHWRCKRALRDGEKMVTGEIKPRSFF